MPRYTPKRMAAWILVLGLLLSMLSGCGIGAPSGGGNEAATLPKTITLVAESPAIEGSPEVLSFSDSAPVAAFSMELMKQALENARENGAENPVLSPISVYMALMVAACGSRGQSQEEFARVLYVPEDEWDAWGSRLMRHMNWTKETSWVTVANSLWVDTDVRLDDDYLQRVSQHLYTDAYQGDLQSQDMVEAVDIWVEDKTQGMISEFRQDPYDSTIMMSILNAVYLEAKWQEPFMASGTEERAFYTAETEEVLALFLTDSLCRRDYVQGEGLDGILLPYQDGNLAFVALRPTAGQSTEELLLSLEVETWKEFCDSAADVLMNVSMPKFTVEYQQDLTEILGDMGLETALTESGIGIGQTVKIQVDEKGTKAAAVTEETQGCASEEPVDPPLELHFDHPYVYAVVDTVTGIPLFVGVMERPAQ